MTDTEMFLRALAEEVGKSLVGLVGGTWTALAERSGSRPRYVVSVLYGIERLRWVLSLKDGDFPISTTGWYYSPEIDVGETSAFLGMMDFSLESVEKAIAYTVARSQSALKQPDSSLPTPNLK